MRSEGGIDAWLVYFPYDRDLTGRIFLHEHCNLGMIENVLLLQVCSDCLSRLGTGQAGNVGTSEQRNEDVAVVVHSAVGGKVGGGKNCDLEFIPGTNEKILLCTLRRLRRGLGRCALRPAK